MRDLIAEVFGDGLVLTVEKVLGSKMLSFELNVNKCLD
jgi:hypothetical protein